MQHKRVLWVVVAAAMAATGVGVSSAPAVAAPVVSFTIDQNPTDPSELTLQWSVTGGRSTNLLYIYPDVGFRPQDCSATANECSFTLRVPQPGIYRYTLSVRDDAGDYTQVTADAVVPDLEIPVVSPSEPELVDMWATGSTSLSWTHSSTNPDGFVQIDPPGSGYYSTQYPINGSLPIDIASMPLGTKATGWGGNPEQVYAVRYCEDRASSDVTAPVAGTVTSIESTLFGFQTHVVARKTLLVLDPDGGGDPVDVDAPVPGVPTHLATPIAVGDHVNAGEVVATMTHRFCSDGALARFWKGQSRFDEVQRNAALVGDGYRTYIEPFTAPVPAGDGVTVTWEGPTYSGSFWRVRSDSLGFESFETSQSTFIPGDLLTADGLHELEITSCRFLGSFTEGECDTADLIATGPGQAGEVLELHPPASLDPFGFGVTVYLPGDPVATLDDGAGGTIDVVFPATPAYGQFDGWVVEVGDTVAAEEVILTVKKDTIIRDQIQLVVGDPWTSADPAAEFSVDRYEAWPWRRSGVRLDVAVTDAGDIYSVGEFSWGMISVVDDTVDYHDIPIYRDVDDDTGLYEQTQPFRTNVAPSHPKSSFTQRHERIIEAPDGTLWWAQGGGSNITESGNRSRIISFDPDGTDVDWTVDDERFCVYNVPGDNNEVVGVLHDGTRLWYGEVGFTNDRVPKLSSFVPSEVASCGNQLDFGQWPVAVPPSPPQSDYYLHVCTTAGETGCVTERDLPSEHSTPAGDFISIAHLTLDADDQAIWFTDWNGNYLGRYDLTLDATPTAAWTHYRLNPTVGHHIGAPGPWQIRVDDSYVWFNEYFDGSVVRFDKADTTNPACQVTAGEQNPCMDELLVPLRDEHDRVHSIDLDDRGTASTADDRIWFTRETGGKVPYDRTSSSIGYIPAYAWDTPVIFEDLDNLGVLVDPNRTQTRHTQITGIDVNDADCSIVINDFTYRQILRLNPTSGCA